MSHTSNNPPVKYAASDLPNDLPEGTVAYDTTNQKMVAFKQGAWGDLGGAGGIGSTTYVRGNAAGVIDQIQGDIPAEWKRSDTSLRGLVIGTSCKAIGKRAFQAVSSSTGRIVIPGSVKTIGFNAFSAAGIDELHLEPGLEYIGSNCFYGNGNLINNLILPDGLKEIASIAFASTGISYLKIPPSVNKLNFSEPGWAGGGHQGSFAAMYYLTRVDCYVTKNIIDMNEGSCFADCDSLTEIHVRSTDSTWTAGSGQTIGGISGITVIKDL